MVGRTSTRSARSTSAAPRKTAKSRASAATIEIPDEGPDTTLRSEIAQIFEDAQTTTATQRKLQTMLRKIQERCCYEPPPTKPKRVQEEDADEEQFNDEVTRCILRVMNVKKGLSEADRVIRFVSLFLRHAADKDRAIMSSGEDTSVADLEETFTSRLSAKILNSLIALLYPPDSRPASSKIVRYRATQTLTAIVCNLETIDDELFALIRVTFKKLSKDKEATVRTQAVMGLSRLMPTEDEDEDDDEDEDGDAHGIMQKLLFHLQQDPSTEVRRTILHNLEQTTMTLRYMFERARDKDPMVRRIVYRRILPLIGDFRYMKLVEREKLLRWGLEDRDTIVSTAAARVFCDRWLEDCAKTYDQRPEEERQPGVPAPPSLNAVTELLERISVDRSGLEGGIAHAAMRKFWEIRTDYRDFITFQDKDYWTELDPPRAFLARSLNDYLDSLGDEDIQLRQDLEDKYLDMSQFTYILRTHMNRLTEAAQAFAHAEITEQDEAEIVKRKVEAEEQDFVVQQLLHIALTQDYSPPLARRQMFDLSRNALTQGELPEECTKLVIQLLRICTDSDSDFGRIILETIAEVRDALMPEDDTEKGSDADEESFHSAQSDVESDDGRSADAAKSKRRKLKAVDPEEEERRREIEFGVYAKCLHIAQCTLQNVECNLHSDSSLMTILNTLIIPAVRDKEAIIREQGIRCLALAAVLSEDLAVSNVDLFLHCFAKGHDNLKELVIELMVDLVTVHPSMLKTPDSDNEGDDSEEDAEAEPNRLVILLTKMILQGLKSDNEDISYKACAGAAKLLLGGYLPSVAAADIVKAFSRTYFDPEGVSQPVKQALSYCIPTFCHIKVENALLMAQICVPVCSKLLQIQEEFDEEEDSEMVGWPVITAHFADWTDGRKVVGQSQTSTDGKISFTMDSEQPHLYLAIDILERALSSSCTRDERKPLLSLLTKLHIEAAGPASDQEALENLHALVNEAVENQIGMDATQRNALTKLEAALSKRISDLAATPAPKDKEAPETASLEQGEVETEDVDVDEDTMMAGMQAESTRMPLEDDDNSDEGEAMEATAITENDIVQSLLATEMDLDSE